MKTLIKLKIKKFAELEEEYFIATSDDLEGLVAEEKTRKEVVVITQNVAKVLLELEKETDSNLKVKDVLSIFEYPSIVEV